ncbi:MAG: tRNA lysidine(34) synthetase TilS [Acidobacteria bacterium]|nr:tRNA lysidine(34) synthetase TilS [Acidobacteriota bacterium]MCB9398673.1 tRNA lysidine(34) synthetase TilS [Acidobacteriota bacterium]
MKSPLLQRLAKPLHSEPFLGADHLWVGVSGGVDSMVLLDCLLRLVPQKKIRVAHVHHGTGPFAYCALDLVQSYCQTKGIPLSLLRFNADPQQNFEGQARQARYAFFQSLAGAHDLILTAHHADDQIESFFHLLLRGANLTTPLGMFPQNAQVVRPLLQMSRKEILNHAQKAQVPHVLDPTNSDTSHLRNLLRHQVIPELEAFHFRFGDRLGRWLGQFHTQQAHLKRAAQMVAEQHWVNDGLARTAFSADQPYLWPYLLDLFLDRVGRPFLTAHQRAITIDWLESGQIGSWTTKSGTFYCDSDALVFWPHFEFEPLPFAWSVELQWGPLRFFLEPGPAQSEQFHLFEDWQLSGNFSLPVCLPKHQKERYRKEKLPLRWRSILPDLVTDRGKMSWTELQTLAERELIRIKQTQLTFFSSNPTMGSAPGRGNTST